MADAIKSKYGASGFVESRIGGRRENQDSAGVRDTALGLLVVVCDGMGGMQGGLQASTIAVTAILSYFDTVDKQSDPAMTLVKAINMANTQIIERSKADPSLAGMGTTVTALLKTPQSAIVAHVGDSRIYQFRQGKKVFRTFDHSMVFEMVKKKVLTEEQARLSTQSNVILKALGVKPDVEVEWHELPYVKGDRFVLCSDGFWGAMPESDFIEMATKDAPADKVLAKIANTVEEIGRKKPEGDYDNLTAAFVEIESNSKMQIKMNTLAKSIIGVLAVLLVVSIGFNGYNLIQKGNESSAPTGTAENDSINVNGDSTIEVKVTNNQEIDLTQYKQENPKEQDSQKKTDNPKDDGPKNGKN